MNNRAKNLKAILSLLFLALCLGNLSFAALWIPQLLGLTNAEILVSETLATSSILLFFVMISLIFYFAIYSILFEGASS